MTTSSRPTPPINRGNSGGPLFNMDGKVIGINTAIYSPSGGSVGIGFSVPSNLAKPVVTQLRQYGHARRGWLGVRIQQVTPDIAESLGLKEPSAPWSPASTMAARPTRRGIRNGDVILKFNGQDVKEMRTLPRIVAETEIGKAVPVDHLARRQGGHRCSASVGETAGRRAAGERHARPGQPRPRRAGPR